MNCYRCGCQLEEQPAQVPGEYAGERYEVKTEALVCPSCGYVTLGAEQLDAFQVKLADAYRSGLGLLTAEGIRQIRQRLGMSQGEFARYLHVGVASVRRWELGKAQDKSMDDLIRVKCQPPNARQNLLDLRLRYRASRNSPIYTGGPYIAYSELFDRKPAREELAGILKELNRLHTVLLLSRVNTHIRHALQDVGRKEFTWVQGFLTRNFIDDDVLKRLQERFPLVQMGDRPIFHPLQILNVMRIALSTCAGDETRRPDESEYLRFQLGRAGLMMNDLLLTEEEEQAIAKGSAEERQTQLMAQMLAPYELMNPANPHHLLLRSHVLFRLLLQNESVRTDIWKTCRGFDIEDRFRQVANIELGKWLSLVFASYSYYMARSVEELVEQPQLFVIHRTAFIARSGVTQDEMDAFLATVSIPFDELCRTVSKRRPVDPRFDVVPFRARPLYVLSEGNFACVDPALLLEKMYSGVHWLIHDGVPKSERNDLFKAWGRLFEFYVDWLFRGISRTLPASFLSFPGWQGGKESFDGAFLKESVFVPLEYKGGFLAQEAKYSGRVDALISELERKIVPGCEQLASKIGFVFHADPIRRRALPDAPVQHVTRILPILVTQDHALRGLFVNWWLNNRFKDLMRPRPLRAGVEVLPLNVVNIEDLETLVESADCGSFDFIYALHNRAVRDPEMNHDLHNFLFGSPGYGARESERWRRIYNQIKHEMLSYTFPGHSTTESEIAE